MIGRSSMQDISLQRVILGAVLRRRERKQKEEILQKSEMRRARGRGAGISQWATSILT
jgi:hypothetical protein